MPIEDALTAFNESLYSIEVEEETGEDQDAPPLHDPFMEALVRGTVADVVDLDAYIAKRAEHWRLERMPIVDRNILRLAIYEMKVVGTPTAVIIDEALELARRFSEEEAVPFINGVLDSIHKLIEADHEAQSAGESI